MACRPTPGTTYLTIGQDLFSISQYVEEQYNASLHEYIIARSRNATTHAPSSQDSIPTKQSVLPAAFMFYTDIQTVRGLTAPVDYGSGIEFANALIDNYNDSNLQIGLWLNGTKGCLDIIQGTLNVQIQTLFEYLVSQGRNGHRIFLRIGYEFDNPDFGYDHPDDYKMAFRYLVDYCKRQYGKLCDDTIYYTWHSWAAGSSRRLEDYFPGADYVDWVGISLFSQLYSSKQRKIGSMSTVKQVLDFAALHDKPVMIAESTPYGGIPDLDDPWRDWFAPVLQLIDDYDIAMWSYINCDWPSQPMWRYAGFGDTRISVNHTIMQKWRSMVVDSPRFKMKLNCDAVTTTTTANPSLSVSSVGLVGLMMAALVLLFRQIKGHRHGNGLYETLS